MANLWLRTLDSMTMNSEEHSEVFVDANDQRDWPVDDSVEAFMQARFRVLSMPHDEVQRYLSILRRRYSPHADDSSATLGALSALSGESTRLGATPHTSSLSVSPSMDTPPSHLLSLSSSDKSQTVSPIRLASPSSVTPARPDASHSPYSSGNLTAAAAGLGVASLTFDSIRAAEMNELRAQLRDEMRHDLKLELQSLANTSGSDDLLRAELVHFKQACAAQEKRIQELESERAQGTRILPSVFSPALSAQPPGFTIQVSLTNLQSTLILAWLLSSGSSVFWRTKLVRLSLSRTIILLLRLTF